MFQLPCPAPPTRIDFRPARLWATAAAAGVLTPMPCVPVTPAPWTPGAAMVQLGGMPALHDGCTLQCVWGGVISVLTPGRRWWTSSEAPTPRKGKRRGAR
jgi:hypothetical protein